MPEPKVIRKGDFLNSEYGNIDGGHRYILVELPDDIAKRLPDKIEFSVLSDIERGMLFLTSYLRSYYDIDANPCIRSGGYFDSAAWITVHGNRCLITKRFGYDI